MLILPRKASVRWPDVDDSPFLAVENMTRTLCAVLLI